MAENSTYCDGYILYSAELWSEINTTHKILLITCLVLTCVTCVIFLESVYYMTKKIPVKFRRNKMIWIFGLHPVFSITSCVGLFVPRSAVMSNFTASIYVSIILYVFLTLMVDYYGGIDNMHHALEDKLVKLSTLPVLCCCLCLPKIKLHKNSKILRRLILQNAIARPFILFISSALWLDGRYSPEEISFVEPYFWLSFLSVLSTATAMQGIGIVQVASREALEEYKLTYKALTVQLALVFSNIQLGAVRLFSSFGLIPCQDPFGEVARVYNIYNTLVIFEFFLMSFFSRVFFRTRRMGNLHHRASITASSMKELEARQTTIQYDIRSEQNNPAFSTDLAESENNGRLHFECESSENVPESGGQNNVTGIDEEHAYSNTSAPEFHADSQKNAFGSKYNVSEKNSIVLVDYKNV
ncbi:organic solute transporter subunit alpha-like [Ptychodera flava]|uniref:organic solute transporter subunit alpha-like n=1 Tax=Ptychodera flava TaxID=63121 RepID=UPI00396A0BA5